MAALSVFMFSTNYYWLAFARFLSGLFQVFIQIVAPVWVDVYGPSDRKTKWLTILIGAGPLGLVAGYLLAAFVVSFWNWKWAFAAKIMILGCLASALMFLNSKSIDVSKR
jgi:MFS family permease